MPALQRGRPLKRWVYAGVFGPELMLCAGSARVGPIPLRWWAIAEPGRPLAERTTVIASGGVTLDAGRVRVRAPGVRIELELEAAGAAVEVASPAGGAYIWTRKLPVVARGEVEVRGRRHGVLELPGLVDESAGYHDHETVWNWSAGAGTTEDGRSVTWNLVTGVHDDPAVSERSVWVDGHPAEVGPVIFDPGLTGIRFTCEEGTRLHFEEWAARESRLNAGLLRNVYRQPFGTFTGSLPGELSLRKGWGVMEEHDARW